MSAAHMADRWRALLPEQQEHVLHVLRRGKRDARRYSERARERSSRPVPWGGFAAQKSLIHAANCGACDIALLLLEAVGCVDDRRPKDVRAAVCPSCGGHGRQPCECLPKEYDDVAELVGRVDCELCHGDGDFACQHCEGSGGVLTVRAALAGKEKP